MKYVILLYIFIEWNLEKFILSNLWVNKGEKCRNSKKV